LYLFGSYRPKQLASKRLAKTRFNQRGFTTLSIDLFIPTSFRIGRKMELKVHPMSLTYTLLAAASRTRADCNAAGRESQRVNGDHSSTCVPNPEMMSSWNVTPPAPKSEPLLRAEGGKPLSVKSRPIAASDFAACANVGFVRITYDSQDRGR